MKKEELKAIITEEGRKVLNSETWFNKETSTYEDEIYTDYRDEEALKNHLMDVIKNNSDCRTIDELRDKINEDYFEIFEETSFDMRHHIEKMISDKVIDRLEELYGADLDMNEYQDEVYDMISEFLEAENYQVVYPDKLYYNDIELGFNVVLDTGDGNYDFTLNSIDDLDENPTLDKESSLLWLIHQQGYKLSDIKNATEENKFLSSVEYELLNVHQGMNTVTFFVKMNLTQYLSIQEKLKSEEECNLIIPMSAICGLVDYWNGSGSLLEITLEKDVVIPKEYIWKVNLDDDIGRYGVAEIYGYYKNDDSIWNTDIKVS